MNDDVQFISGELRSQLFACAICNEPDMQLFILDTENGPLVVMPVEHVLAQIAHTVGHAIDEHSLGVKPDERHADTGETFNDFVQRKRQSEGN